MGCGTNSLNSITRRGERRVEKWERPADGWYKVNSNGALRTGDRIAASGGAWQMGGRRVVLEIDSATAVQMLLGCEAENQGSGVLRAAKGMLKRDWIVKVQHVQREGTQ
ncbi:hypothetical protein PVK06_042568 [Gossypium arboreum]|uniref:RNase H type-1 domain-containing protein n=1 Tax=Gossypium arboreum TaxID=29729 RepID=A0ABR0MLH5_GOSAR|nr:hypothetical protein PVK06_042568 [Gossypium arboreum]